MSHKTQGTIYRTESGKYLRTYRTHTHIGYRDHLQETPDILCATVFREGTDLAIRRKIDAEYGNTLTPLVVEVTREIKVLQDGGQPCLL